MSVHDGERRADTWKNGAFLRKILQFKRSAGLVTWPDRPLLGIRRSRADRNSNAVADALGIPCGGSEFALGGRQLSGNAGIVLTGKIYRTGK